MKHLVLIPASAALLLSSSLAPATTSTPWATKSASSGIVRLGKLNVDQARQLSQEQGVRSIPNVRFYIDGKLVHKFTGAAPKETIESLIATHSANIDPTAGMVARLKTGFAGVDGGDGTTATVPARPRPTNAKPIEEAIKPMKKDWLPPGMSQK
ncbi:MAG: thioredoxin family protein [Akkermansiaceae bacterium]|nr:thioredoxin family protein [Akkermansiaceae bacterium]